MPRKTPSERRRGGPVRWCFNEAAARCRGKPRGGGAKLKSGSRKASMRPRPDAAENRRRGPISSPVSLPRFNEAAARCRGKPSRRSAGPTGWWSRFNEAAARCRGKPFGWRATAEAAAAASMRPRPDAAENPEGRGARDQPVQASMRPRPDAAENRARRHDIPATEPASMRPRPDAAENRAQPPRPTVDCGTLQ